MKTANEIEDEFRSKSIQRGGILLFNPTDGISVIQKCHEENLKILGIDGFRLTATHIQPLMEHSVDLSSDINPKLEIDNWQRAEEFLRLREQLNLVFELVIE